MQQQQQDAANQSLVDQVGQMANAPLADPTKNPQLLPDEEPPTE